MTIDKELIVDLNRVQPHRVIKIHEGDTDSVFLSLTVTIDGSSVSLSGLTIKYDATIAGYLAEQDASGSVADNKIRIPVTGNMTSLPGTLKIDVRMISGTQVLYTQTITMIVDKSVIDNSTIIDFDGTTIGGRLKTIEDDLEEIEIAVDLLEARFPVEETDIASDAVSTVKLQNGAVTGDKIATTAFPVISRALFNITLNDPVSGRVEDGATPGFNGKTIYSRQSESFFICTNVSGPDAAPTAYTWTKVPVFSYITGNYRKVTVWDYPTSLANNFTIPLTYAGEIGDTVIMTTGSGTGGSIWMLFKIVANLGSSSYYWYKLGTSTDSSGKMDLIPKVNDPDNIPLLENGQIFSCQGVYGVKDSTLTDGYQLIADFETGTVAPNHAWYTDESAGYTMTGSYSIIGDMCFLHAKAYIIPGWERVYYSLPIFCTASGSTIGLHNSDFFSIATGTQNNISVLEIKQIGSQFMSGEGTIRFTLIYKCT